MRTSNLVLAASALAFIASLGFAGKGHAADAPAAKVSVDPASIVNVRQTAFKMSVALLGDLKAAGDAGGDLKPQAFRAKSLANWARQIPAMFPEGTNIAPTKAQPAVWSNRADFEAKAASYAAEADKLAGLATAGDAAGFKAQIDVVAGTCGACHSAYRGQ